MEEQIKILSAKAEILDRVNPQITDLGAALQNGIQQLSSRRVQDQVDRLQSELDQANQQLATKASLNRPYRIKSEKVAVYVGVRDAPAAYGGAISLGDARNGPQELGLQWRLVEDW